MSTLTTLLAVAPLADEVPDPKDVSPGWIAAVVILVLIVVTVLLWLNMRKQLGRIDFEEDADEPGRSPGAGAADGDPPRS